MSVKTEIVKLLENYADLLEFKGENPFKIRAFKFGANAIRQIEGDIEDKVKEGSLKNVKGIGKGILSVIEEFISKGSCADYEELYNSIPEGVIELFKIRGLGVKKVKTLHEELNINNIDDLAEAAVEDKVAGLSGFGMKTQENIVAEIARIKSSRGLIHYYRAIQIGKALLNELLKIQSVTQGEITGELRRGLEVVSSIDLLLCINDENDFIKTIEKSYTFTEADEGSHNCVVIDLDLPIHVKVYYVLNVSEFQSTLFYTTGSKDFLKEIHFVEEKFTTKSEAGIFRALDFPYIIPEMREHEMLNTSAELRKNSDLTLRDFSGLLHFHTTYSDGLNSLTEMGDAAAKLGFEYLAVCDHSKSAFYANGLEEERILLQKKELAKLNKSTNIHYFQGIESDILNSGSLDYSSDFMQNFEFVVASVHSGFNLSEDDMTKRVITAIENEYTDVLGHPTGRLLLSRNPYKINMKKIIDACAQNDVAIEINSNPFRLDLDWRLIFYAREKGCEFAINPDAHSVDGIKDVEYGITMGRKGGLQKSEVINCLSTNDFVKFLNRKVKRI